MAASATVRKLFRTLLASPGSKTVMLVLADALEDDGKVELAEAYRWAAMRHKWPHRLTGQGPKGLYVSKSLKADQTWHLYDWTRWVPRKKRGSRHWEERSMLPKPLLGAIFRQNGRRYGGVHRAFMILARALQAVGATQGVGQ